jgi:SAM-dependent methyltransferase
MSIEVTDTPAFADVTEKAGDGISAEQLRRTCNRYYWAGDYVDGKDVIEVACGSGLGLGYLAARARTLRACDIDDDVLRQPRAYYGAQVRLDTADAAKLPYEDASADVILLFEAIYYLPDVDVFFDEARRVLRPDGQLLIVSANKDLYDFNPSPYSTTYFGADGLAQLCRRHGFSPKLFGYLDVSKISLRQRLFRPIKRLAVAFGLVPKSMQGKEALKRVVFGPLFQMPASILVTPASYDPPAPVFDGEPDKRHKVLYCAASRASSTSPTSGDK